ncbi:DegT/DnrJ/EryC1/StrS family aminotransferase [Myxococcota bacterium]|nr:DegT/DnrJ/EryC1/StrS family aminotransferase [Myxococcota bacterium]MBU1429932.1 DegT/DnrJ/EryC1/StrS family aminotransferase [Myxococcota bacterium]MBU1897698.1 DegT/DnrJ/EryC1/StrS family aminotransferase [Myxococcota bacterium]
MPIPLLDLEAQHREIRDELLEAVIRVIDSQGFIMGPEVTGFEAELAAWTGVRAVAGVSSGTDALLAALMALDVGPGDEVITSAFTFFATAGAPRRLGAIPVFVDVDPHTFDLTEEAVRAAITPRTKAIIPVHLFGRLCDLGGLYDDPDAPPIIEDAAQSLGAHLGELRVGQLGRITCTSFFPAKNLGAFGDAGAILSNDEALMAKVRLLRVHGSAPKYHHQLVGGNFRLDALQAAVLRVKLKGLNAQISARQENAARYRALFEASGLIEEGNVEIPRLRPDEGHVFNQYVIRAARRDALAAHLQARGISTAVYYPTPLHLQPCFADLGYPPGSLPETEQACRVVLALPIHPTLTPEQIAEVAGAVFDFYRTPA